MGIMTRVVKIFKADIHGVMDQLEDQGLLLKQYLRDMEDALVAGEARLQRKVTARNQARQEYDKLLQQTELLERDLAVAIKKSKDDIARMLIKKLKPVSDLRNDIARHISILNEEIAELKERLNRQKLKYAQIKHRALKYSRRSRYQARWDDLSDMPVNTVWGELSEEEIELELFKRKEAQGFTETASPIFNGQPTTDH
jgi:phage shock protein A